MRADRLVSLVLLLRQRGRLSASVLARELEVSRRTVLRDVEALSTAGVPIYAERGRLGGFELLPGFRVELTGLTHDEALALLVAGSRPGAEVFGLGSALASAMLKVVDALPESSRETATGAAGRLLVDPQVDLLGRRADVEDVIDAVATPVRRAVLAGRRLRLRYATPGRAPVRRTVDPVGLVSVRGTGYLLATVDGTDRTYRLSRIRAAEVLEDAARRSETVELEELWRARGTAFRAGGEVVDVRLRVAASATGELTATALALALREVAAPPGGWVPPGEGPDPAREVVATFQDVRHAEWALWQLGTRVEVLDAPLLREALRERALDLARHLGHAASGHASPGPVASGHAQPGTADPWMKEP